MTNDKFNQEIEKSTNKADQSSKPIVKSVHLNEAEGGEKGKIAQPMMFSPPPSDSDEEDPRKPKGSV